MALSKTFSRANLGIEAPLITIETHIDHGLPKFLMVGLPETVVKESKERVRSALIASGFKFPNGRITVNLAPAGLPKYGSRFDLAIALSILGASKQIPINTLDHYEYIGELALSGTIRPVTSIVSSAQATDVSQKILVIPTSNAKEASLIPSLKMITPQNLLALCAHLTGSSILPYYQDQASNSHDPKLCGTEPQQKTEELYLSDVDGNAQAKRALIIAAAGQHHLIFTGPPGTGKSMMAKCLPSLLPILNHNEALEIALLRSAAQMPIEKHHLKQRPCLAPHHTASASALVGGSNPPQPGIISQAHHGVMILDELPEYSRATLEALREPLELRKITIARSGYQTTFPANFQLVATCNPCPCGYLNDPHKSCQCTPQQIRHYKNRLSGPLLDRIDILVPLQSKLKKNYFNHTPEQTTYSHEILRKKVLSARLKQLKRSNCLNAQMNTAHIKKYCGLSLNNQRYLEEASEQLKLSTRRYMNILKVARTIADFRNSHHIEKPDLLEAISYQNHPT